jgi:Mn2+/Fe2+ NRAMP family transporter
LKSGRSERSAAILGAAFLMATSAIGPGFLTQTTIFTQQLAASFAFVILTTILVDICVQLNIWRIIGVSELPAQELANKVLPGLGYFLAALVALGGMAFNIGNIAGCGLGVNVLTGIDTKQGAILSGVIALFIFWMKEAGKVMDNFAKVLGILMILLTLYVAVSSHPPVAIALKRAILPERIDLTAIITLIGGTVGGYISFAGVHRLLDAGIKGKTQIPQITRGAVSGILITGVMRLLLFFAALGVVMSGTAIDAGNPAASVFRIASGEMGYKFFGVVIWSAAITSVVGAAYTSVSFLKTFHPAIARFERWVISLFIILSTAVFIIVGKPVQLLVIAGTLNGLILPVAIATMLFASGNKSLMNGYRHPLWMKIGGWITVVITGWLSYETIKAWIFS